MEAELRVKRPFVTMVEEARLKEKTQIIEEEKIEEAKKGGTSFYSFYI